MPKNETQTQWQDRMALEVLEVTRSELYLHLRFLSLAIGGLAPTPSAHPRRRRSNISFHAQTAGNPLQPVNS